MNSKEEIVKFTVFVKILEGVKTKLNVELNQLKSNVTVHMDILATFVKPVRYFLWRGVDTAALRHPRL